jgi:DNA polymerase-4
MTDTNSVIRDKKTAPTSLSLPRRILLADADAFFVAVARMVDPEGAGKAELLIVGGSRESRGVVCSASYETRKYGVRSAMPIAQALRLCPSAVCVPVPRAACSKKSREIRTVLQRFAPIVEGASIDEWYLDLGGTESLYGNEPLDVTAQRIRAAVVEETGLTISIGGGTNKLVAKLAVEYAKPKYGANGVYIVPPGDEAKFMEQLNLADIPMIGPKFQEKLGKFGMRTVPDVLQYSLETLERWFGAREARWLYDRVRGIDDRPVEGRGEAKSISRDETFAHDISDDSELEQELLRLVVRAASDLRSSGIVARTITVRIRDYDFKNRSASRTLPEPVMSDRIIYSEAKTLLHKLRSARRVPARLLSVSLSSLAADPAADQLALFETVRNVSQETEKDRIVARTVDQLRAKFGNNAVLPLRLQKKKGAEE